MPLDTLTRPAPTFVPTMPEAAPYDRATVMIALAGLRGIAETLRPVVREGTMQALDEHLASIAFACPWGR